MQLRLLAVWCLVTAAAGATLQNPFFHDSSEDQLAMASSVSSSTLQDPFPHTHREDQLAGPRRVAAPDTKLAAPYAKKTDRTPTARVPAPALQDVIVLDASDAEETAPPRPAVLPSLQSWLRGAGPYPGWLRGAVPYVVLLQPIFLPVPVREGEAAFRRPNYYGAADPARLARLRELRRRRSPDF